STPTCHSPGARCVCRGRCGPRPQCPRRVCLEAHLAPGGLQILASPATLRGAMTSIGVVIVSFNTCDLLRGCLESLRGCALPLRTIVVENGSRDASAAMVRACFPEAELVALEHNVGFAAGTNVGLGQLGIGECRLEDHPTPNYVLLLNPDTIVHAGAIERLAA